MWAAAQGDCGGMAGHNVACLQLALQLRHDLLVVAGEEQKQFAGLRIDSLKRSADRNLCG